MCVTPGLLIVVYYQLPWSCMFLEEEMHQRHVHGTIHSSVGSGEQRSTPTRCSWDSQPCCLASWEDCNALLRRKRGIVPQDDCVCVCLAHAMCLSSPISVPDYFTWSFLIKHISSPFLKAYTTVFLFSRKCVCMYCALGRGHPLRGHCKYRLYCYHMCPQPPQFRLFSGKLPHKQKHCWSDSYFSGIDPRIKCHD